jgi:predicted nucleic-acid-binding Zn-ribbon protein
MSSPLSKCPKCDSEMMQGFMLDFHDSPESYPSLWIAGSPDRSWWVGTKLVGKEVRETITMRCTQCGFLESYARELWKR